MGRLFIKKIGINAVRVVTSVKAIMGIASFMSLQGFRGVTGVTGVKERKYIFVSRLGRREKKVRDKIWVKDITKDNSSLGKGLSLALRD